DCETLLAKASRLAQAFLARAEPGSVVSFMLPNWHEAALIYLAASLAGMVVNPILPSLRERELSFILKDADTRLLFAPAQFRHHDYAAMLSAVRAQLDRPPEMIILRGDPEPHIALDALLESHPTADFPTLDPDAVRLLLYTSGTTGRPKG